MNQENMIEDQAFWDNIAMKAMEQLIPRMETTATYHLDDIAARSARIASSLLIARRRAQTDGILATYDQRNEANGNGSKNEATG